MEMKNLYYFGGDVFLAVAFVSFITGAVLKLLGISTIWLGVTANQVINGSIASLLFSVALNISELVYQEKKK